MATVQLEGYVNGVVRGPRFEREAVTVVDIAVGRKDAEAASASVARLWEVG
jgi:hypothetical protein